MGVKNVEKFKELLAFIVVNFNSGDLFETKLWKIMYFCEADYYEKNRRTITGINYFKNNFGPTPDKTVINEAIRDLKDLVSIREVKRFGGSASKLYESRAKDDSELKLKYLSADEIEEARRICEKYYKLSVRDIVILAHKDAPYLGAEMKDKIDFEFVDYRDNNDLCDDIKYSGKVPSGAIEKLLSYVR